NVVKSNVYIYVRNFSVYLQRKYGMHNVCTWHMHTRTLHICTYIYFLKQVHILHLMFPVLSTYATCTVTCTVCTAFFASGRLHLNCIPMHVCIHRYAYLYVRINMFILHIHVCRYAHMCNLCK